MQKNAFNELKKKWAKARLLVLPNFGKTFGIECDASGLGIVAVLIQDGKLLIYFSKKLNEAALNYPIYDEELFVLVFTCRCDNTTYCLENLRSTLIMKA